MSFLTLEDINTCLYSNQGFYWHCLDLTSINQTLGNFTNVKVDFCKVSRIAGQYYITVDIPSWTMGYNIEINGSYVVPSSKIVWYENQIVILSDVFDVGDEIKLFLYIGVEKYSEFTRITYKCTQDNLLLNLKELKTTKKTSVIRVDGADKGDGGRADRLPFTVGYNSVVRYIQGEPDAGFIFVNFLKTDFQFNCNQELINGKINTVQLGVDADYKPNGDLVGDYAPEISVFYGDETLAVTWNPTINDYTFDIDLSNREKETDVILTVFVENNEVLNQTSRDVRLHTRFENIDSIAKLNTLFQNGGIGRLDANLVLTNDLTISNDVYLLGNHHNINMAENKLIISENKTFKCEQTGFSNGENTIQQKVGSKVELTECSFTNCTGLGSVIDCQIDRTSLTNPTDFTTNLEKCVFDSCDMMILHGGELSVTNCVVNGENTKVDNPNYPFFLYQTDGTARILQSEFNFIHDTDIDEDIEFNSCIFVCGETAEINGYDHTELQKNNLTQFLEIQRNTSKIDVTYYYPAIEDYITLQSNNGFCHAVSNVDYIFKTNVTPQRR